MAITLPVYRANSVSAKAANNGAITPALPTGVTAGDLVILICGCLGGETLSITTNGSIGTWTQIINQDITGAITAERLYIWYGIYSSGSTGPTVTPSPGDHAIGATLAYTVNTFDATSPINISGSSSEATADTSFSWATGLSTTKNNCLVLVGVTNGIDSNTAQHGGAFTNANLANIATRVNYNTNSGGGGGIGLAEGSLATAGAIGTWAETYATASYKAYGTFAINGKQTSPFSFGFVLP